MNLDVNVVLDSINSLFIREAIILCFFALLGFAAILLSIFGAKLYLKQSLIKSILIISLTFLCALTLVAIRAKMFIPILNDYKSKAYTIEQNAKVCIIEGTNNVWDQKNQVLLRNQAGEEIRLVIVNDYKFETGTILEGTVVYTNHSKHIIWYDFSPISDNP
jgi:hypothetical protein